MATLFITVWDDAAQVALGNPIQQMTIPVGGVSTQSSIIDGKGNAHKRIRLLSDVNCFVSWGVDPTALNDGTGGIPLGAENPEYHGVLVGQKIAVIERL